MSSLSNIILTLLFCRQMANIKQNMLSRILVRGDDVGTVYLWTSGVQFLYNVFFRLIRKTLQVRRVLASISDPTKQRIFSIVSRPG